MAYTLTTQYGTFKYQKPIALTIATTIFLSGLNLLNGNLLYLIIYAFAKEEQQPLFDTPWYIYLMGFSLIALSMFVFYLLIINWRIEVYSKLFYQLQKVTNTYGTAHIRRMRTYSGEILIPLHTEAYQAYREAKQFLDENSATVDQEVDELFSKLLLEIGRLIEDLDYYIKQSNPLSSDFSPNDANIGANEDYVKVLEKYRALKLLVRKRERFKL